MAISHDGHRAVEGKKLGKSLRYSGFLPLKRLRVIWITLCVLNWPHCRHNAISFI